MLEAIIDLRRDNATGAIGGKETDEKKAGDIIAVKKSPAVWGKKEKEDFLIVKLDDPDLEASIGNSPKVYPYAVEEDGEVVNRSRKKIDHTEWNGTGSLDRKKEVGAVERPAGGNMLVSDLPDDGGLRRKPKREGA